MCLSLAWLTHWGRVNHLCFSKVTIISSDNGLLPGRCQAIIWSNAGVLLIGSLGTNFSIMFIEIHIFSFKKMELKMSSGNWRPFCLGLSVGRPVMYLPWWSRSSLIWIMALWIWILHVIQEMTKFVICKISYALLWRDKDELNSMGIHIPCKKSLSIIVLVWVFPSWEKMIFFDFKLTH